MRKLDRRLARTPIPKSTWFKMVLMLMPLPFPLFLVFPVLHDSAITSRSSPPLWLNDLEKVLPQQMPQRSSSCIE
jgi:hypothetical protein